MCDVRAIRLAQVAWVGWRRYCPPTDTAWKIAATLIEAADEIDPGGGEQGIRRLRPWQIDARVRFATGAAHTLLAQTRTPHHWCPRQHRPVILRGGGPTPVCANRRRGTSRGPVEDNRVA